MGEQILATEVPPLVVSISYGADEYELGEDWVTGCNEEFGKLALIGTTVLASSGDSGIRGNDDDCLYGDSGVGAVGQQRDDERRSMLNKKSASKAKSEDAASTEYSF